MWLKVLQNLFTVVKLFLYYWKIKTILKFKKGLKNVKFWQVSNFTDQWPMLYPLRL